MSKTTNEKYSFAELAQFQIIIEKKLKKAEAHLLDLEEQFLHSAELQESRGDWIDSATTSNDIDMLQLMANRQRRYIIELKQALQRIQNKTYGVCIVTGKLIDKKRLMVVPTTTKCLITKIDDRQL